MNGETLTGLLKKGQMILAQAGIKEAGLDAWLLLEYVTGKSRAYYFAYGEESVTESVAERYLELISRRAGHIPLQHLTHQAFFMGHEFYVDKNVLVPRQDTETLVESALECMKAVKNPYILDMCTGSGCILISILKERADAHGTGVDLSDEALKVAVRNARTLEVAEHAEFVQSNLFSEMQNIVYGTEYMKRTAVKDTVKMTECENSNRNYSRAYDMIISNPPYIPTAEIEDLMDEVKLHDPRMALDGMEDGLYFYRAITKQAQDHLVPGGWLLYEIGCSQGEDVAALLRKYKFEDIEIRQDLAGLDRVVLGIHIFPNRKEINSSHEIFCINIRRSHVSWIASTFSRKSKVSFFSHRLRIQSGTLFFDCTKWSTYSNRWIFPKCIFRLIQICSKCDSITIYKCHFLMVYFFTLWKSFIPFRYQL